ncbi:rhodanese-like protein [Mycobacteroides abscessus subsp. abscessus]|nr:rhodanese-like protein [Mycobacteroides abscessus subsp. abscessus]
MRPPGHGPTLGGMSEPSVTVTEIPDGAAIIDVREDDEWEAGHIEGAIHVPLGELPERLDDLPLDDDMYIICRTGGRSLRATAWLNLNGFDAYNVEGGMGSWNIDNGKPIVSETGQEPWVK